ncbi:MAG: alpha/beta hydrolase [Betaproteobacteria bacterium RIFCSPLOWO2_02_FULL_62_17]|nr:MAG: alpha/beta hydrolase [Betaproteobacteria bacterium RIFCSPLOWO2_02_FULL_62_17]
MTTETELPYRSIWSDLALTSFRQGFVDAGGIRTRYAQAGRPDAPGLIMIHGTAGSWECFAPNLAAHAEHFNCVAYDMVGCGFSDKPDYDYEIPRYADHLLNLMKALGIRKTSFMGVSLGSWVAARFTVQHPEMVDRLTLMSVAGSHADSGNMARIRNTRNKSVDDPSWENIKSVFVNLIKDERKRIPDLIALRQRVYQLPEMKRAMEHILCLQEPDIRLRNNLTEDEWRSIEAPTLLIAAVDHKDVYLDAAYKLAKIMPNARLVEMCQSAHWPQYEDPDTYNKLNVDFLLGR